MLTSAFIVVASVAVLACLILAFEVWMFIDAIKNPRLDQPTKIIWLLGMILLHPFVAIAYYFLARNPTK